MIKKNVVINYKTENTEKIILPGGAGQVGQNLVLKLLNKGYTNIVVIDKHHQNLSILKALHPKIKAINADLSKPGEWQEQFLDSDIVIMLQAQIGGLKYSEFEKNTLRSTELILDTIKSHGNQYLIHISSSVVNSEIKNFYNRSKSEQEKIILEKGFNCPILRPTLMFGWFDRKHLGWMSRFMKKTPVLPVPGNGRYIRRPLYVMDFCEIIIKCMKRRAFSGIYNIYGTEEVFYIDILKMIKKANHASTLIIPVPILCFYIMLYAWSLINKNPHFTTQQLKYLIAKYDYEITDWEKIFKVKSTPFEKAIQKTFSPSFYSKILMKF